MIARESENESMTVLLVALGSAGDVHPNVGLALALKHRGHRVVLVASTFFAPLARRAGHRAWRAHRPREARACLW